MAYEHRSHRVSGGTGVVLHVDETGNHEGRPVLFVHGFSQCRLAWNRQLGSGLGRDLRLVAWTCGATACRRSRGTTTGTPRSGPTTSTPSSPSWAWSGRSSAAGPTVASSSPTISA